MLTGTIWDIADNVKELMENATGEQQETYDNLSANGCKLDTTTSWTDRISNAGKVAVQGFATAALDSLAKKATKSVASLWAEN